MNIKIDFLYSIKETADEDVWSKGVELSRLSTPVFIGHPIENEYHLSLKDPKSKITYKIHLWTKEGDWSCDCQGKDDPCIHVVACSIALKKESNLTTIPQGEMIYLLKREHGELSFFRQALIDGKTYSLSSSLSAILNGRVKGPNISPTKEDLSLDCLLLQEKEGVFLTSLWQKIFPYLAQCSKIYLDQKPIILDEEPIGLFVQGYDMGGLLEIKGAQDERIVEVFKNGLVLCSDNKLRLLRQPKLSAEHLSWLSSGKQFGLSERNEFLSQILPKWNVPFLYQGKNPLPKTVYVSPKLNIHGSVVDGVFQYQGSLVYGNPPIGIVSYKHDKTGKMEVLSSLEIPIRDFEKEKQIQENFFSVMGHGLEYEKNISASEMKNFETRISRFSVDFKIQNFENFQNDFYNHQDDVFFRSSVSIDSLRDALFQKKSFMTMDQDQHIIRIIPSQWIQKYGSLLLEILESRSSDGKISKIQKERIVYLSESQPKIEEIEDLSSAEKEILIKNIHADLRDYQKEGIFWLQSKKKQKTGAVLADDMGLGKTIQAIGIIEKRTLVVAPTGLLNNWKDEIKKFRPNLSFSIFHGVDRIYDSSSDVVITSYGLLKTNIDLFQSEVWSIIILDESHVIKNPKSLVAESVFQLSSRFRLSLTGTPIENRLLDLWTQFAFICPGLFPNQNEFLMRYEERPDALAVLAQSISPYIKRRLKSQVAKELPERTEKEIFISLSEQEREIYDGLVLGSKQSIVEKLSKGLGVLEAMELLLRLRQASCHLGLLPALKDQASLSTKLSILMEKLDELLTLGHKVLIFSQWTSFLDLIEKEIKQWNYLRIDGQTSISQRQERVTSFQKEKNIPIFLLSLKAAGVGLNLTAADHVFIMDPWWNPTVEDQASDRAHRIGQKNPVFIYRIVAKDTVEEKILMLQKQKKMLAKNLLDGESFEQQHLTSEEILDLLR